MTLLQAASFDLLLFVACAYAAAAGYAAGLYVNRKQARRYRSLSRYAERIERELDYHRKAPPVATVIRMQNTQQRSRGGTA